MGMAASLVMWPVSFEQTFVPPSKGGSIWNMASIGLVVIEENKFKNIESDRIDMDQGQWMTLTFGTHKVSCTYLIDRIYQCLYHWLQ